MKSLLGILGAAAFLAAGSWASGEDAPFPGLPAGVDPGVIKQKLLEKFDANGDGNLTGQELQNAQAALQKQFGGGLNGAGVNLEELKKKFDRDGDGKLSPEEKAAAMAAFQKAKANGGGLPGGDLPGSPASGGLGDEKSMEGKARGREAMIKRFDKDGDGKLSDEEKAEAQKVLKGKKGEARPAGKKGTAEKRKSKKPE